MTARRICDIVEAYHYGPPRRPTLEGVKYIVPSLSQSAVVPSREKREERGERRGGERREERGERRERENSRAEQNRTEQRSTGERQTKIPVELDVNIADRNGCT